MNINQSVDKSSLKKNEGQKAREHEQTRIHVSAWFEALTQLTFEIKIEEQMDPN